MSNFSLVVTRDHIDNAKRRNCNECPIALAMRDLFKEDFDAADEKMEMRPYVMGQNILQIRYNTPHTDIPGIIVAVKRSFKALDANEGRKMDDFISLYDDFKPVGPTFFLIEEKQHE